jgi:hypothetical protein
MAIGTDLLYYTGKGWIPAKLRANLPESSGLLKFRIYVPALDACLNVPALAVKTA